MSSGLEKMEDRAANSRLENFWKLGDGAYRWPILGRGRLQLAILPKRESTLQSNLGYISVIWKSAVIPGDFRLAPSECCQPRGGVRVDKRILILGFCRFLGLYG